MANVNDNAAAGNKDVAPLLPAPAPAALVIDKDTMAYVEKIPPDVYAILEKLRNGDLPKKEMDTLDITKVSGVELAGVNCQLATLKLALADKMSPYIDSIVPTLEAMAPDNKFNKIKQACEKSEGGGKYEFMYVLVKKYRGGEGTSAELYDFYGVGATSVCEIDIPYLGRILVLLVASSGFAALAAGTIATGGGMAMLLAGGASVTASLASGLLGVVDVKTRLTTQTNPQTIESIFEAWVINELVSRGHCTVDHANTTLYALMK